MVIISVDQSSFSSPISPTTSIESEKSWRVSGVPNGVAKDIDAEALQSQDAKPRYSTTITSSPTAGVQEMYENRYKLLLDDNRFLQDSLKREQQAREEIAKLMREECGGLSHQIKMCMEEKRITENNLAEARLEIERLKDFQHTLKAEVDLKDQKIGDLLERIKEHDAAHNLIEEEKSMDELMVERKKSDSFSSKWMAEKEISHSLSLKIAELQRDQYSHQAEIQTLKQSLVEVKNQARGDKCS
ncbi:hypothetical protein GUITHDRAFT_118487 [Guillardia theta CCMP2712]|uniref:Uncharacterized protein n=1 Tax=Guillardia theta (strain CCMP2712) TaxID=905079 RepID=L1IGI8_GUITC|nr:hypothetical protein GUITHDRAFT_118487 [Guillardia theta CCMP2712]EKX35366.1 hypothetical protein GUITHDRAFT_118487 [Guillardia theta CCMP2712]|eukprot:XP_005822346.1 hypothetical protein GUITHDRAFT_118487 [Guillardia theta CCMP2712]